MRKQLLTPLYLLIFLIILGIVMVNNYHQRNLVSPILTKSKLKMSVNAWFPQQITQTFSDAPEISAEAAYFIDTQSGQVLFEKNAQLKLPVASLVKIMTATLALELKDMDDKFLVSEYAASFEPDKMYLNPGESLSLKELLQGMFLVSANDASEVLAESVVGDRQEFLHLMNEKAGQLGMKDTHFINPSGLEEDEKVQYSTAYDVALMSRYAIDKWPQLLEISAQPYIHLEATLTHQAYDLYSGINLLTTYPGVIGFKTGFTPEAGLTLVTVVQKEDRQVLGVLLNASERRDDARVLLDYSFAKLGI